MFTPLAYADCRLDRAQPRRADPIWIEERRRDPASAFVALCRDRNLVTLAEPLPKAVILPATADVIAQSSDTAFLGLAPDGAAWFAVEIEPAAAEALARRCGGRFVDLRRVSGRLPSGEVAILAYARALMCWHRSHQYCGACGGPTISREGGHLRVCADATCATRHFPRTDPVVIVLVTRPGPGEEMCLLARQPGWPQGLMSTLAGFVEPGETVEEAVLREVREEAGIGLVRLAYYGSQPWPFPSSLMLAYTAEAAVGAELILDPGEIEDGRWFTRSQVAAMSSLGLKLPTRDSIARSMIEDWLHRGHHAADAADVTRTAAGAPIGACVQ
jgi:NAD+ diphosphatase